ncbi:MAG: Ig-like domain-containing protein, partial [bacterium]
QLRAPIERSFSEWDPTLSHSEEFSYTLPEAPENIGPYTRVHIQVRAQDLKNPAGTEEYDYHNVTESEFIYGNFDYDGDGLSVNQEDTNGNGVWDEGETDAANRDTDGDTIDDGEEVVPGIDTYITDPTKEDSDGDGFSDSKEIAMGEDPTMAEEEEPVVSILEPSDGTRPFEGEEIIVRVEASDNYILDSVTLFAQGEEIGQHTQLQESQGVYEFPYEIPQDVAQIKISATAKDKAGNKAFLAEITLIPIRIRISTVAGWRGEAPLPAQDTALGYVNSLVAGSGEALYFIVDSCIYKIDNGGMMIRIAGNTRWDTGYSGDEGPALLARLNKPKALAIDSAGGVIYIADTLNHRVRKIETDGRITTIAGNGIPGYSGDQGLALSSRLHSPQGITLDSAGNIYVSDTMNHCIRKIDTATTEWSITTVIGNGMPGYSGDGGPASSAKLFMPGAIVIDDSETIYFIDGSHNFVRKVDSGSISTLAKLQRAEGLALDQNGDVLVADSIDNRIYRITSEGTIQSVAGTGVPGYSGDGSFAINSQIQHPEAVAVSNSGIYIADADNYRIRRFTIGGVIDTYAGNGNYAKSGEENVAINTQLWHPYGVGVNQETVYIADTGNHSIRTFDDNGTPDALITTIAGAENLNYPEAVVADSSGDMYIADTKNHCIRKIDTNGVISIIAGTGVPGNSGDNEAATAAQLNRPEGVAIDQTGALYIADTGNSCIRKIDTDGLITTIAGTGIPGYNGDNIMATGAQLNKPEGLAIDHTGTLYIADTGNNRIRVIEPGGTIRILAGTGVAGYGGDKGLAVECQLNGPEGVAVSSAGFVFIADSKNYRIRMVGPDGIIRTIAGTGILGCSGDGGPALKAQLNPYGIAVDQMGDIFVTDAFYNCVRKISIGN